MKKTSQTGFQKKIYFRKSHSNIFVRYSKGIKVFVTRKNFVASPIPGKFLLDKLLFTFKACLDMFCLNLSDEYELFEVENLTPEVQFTQFWHFFGTLKDCIMFALN